MPNKQDSNVTGLRVAAESSLGTLPGSPIWKPMEPNSYADFGGSVSTVARSPINEGRQRKKGVVVDVDASGGFNTDLTQTNLADTVLEGMMFASYRRKGEEVVTAVDVDASNPDEYEVASTTGFLVGSLIKGSGFTNSANNAVNEVTAVVTNTSVEVADGELVSEGSPPSDAKITVVGHVFRPNDATAFYVDVSGDLPKIVTDLVDLTTLGLIPGEWVFVGGDGADSGFANAANNGWKRVRSISATEMAFDKSESTMVTDDGSDTGSAGNFDLAIEVYFGRVLKNESSSANQVRTSYQLERTLGNDGSGTQSEYLVGSVPNTMTINVPATDKVTVDLTFVSTDHEQRTGTTGVKSGTRPSIVESDAFNTSSDFSRIKMALVSATDENPTALFAFVTELTLTVSNNLTPNKAVGTIGAFDVSAGVFQVSGNLTAYFGDVAATQAVRNNSSVTLDVILAKNNAGIVIDVPLIALGDGRLNVEANQPITLPLAMDAASGAEVVSTMDHTLMLQFFDYLPDAAE